MRLEHMKDLAVDLLYELEDPNWLNREWVDRVQALAAGLQAASAFTYTSVAQKPDDEYIGFTTCGHTVRAMRVGSEAKIEVSFNGNVLREYQGADRPVYVHGFFKSLHERFSKEAELQVKVTSEVLAAGVDTPQ